ncbi:hypothetical protein HPB50_009272 [Hyalomma asiaticum]|uniref:Uncharacterized protein n=1 Tax=Hyalomma asiaticum TaxID=266040 RepID=A0ACB7RV94_HYAAI|nr:hypothetical protein HPB50_009272 [Hyalomma asiaticum]
MWQSAELPKATLSTCRENKKDIATEPALLELARCGLLTIEVVLTAPRDSSGAEGTTLPLGFLDVEGKRCSKSARTAKVRLEVWWKDTKRTRPEPEVCDL